MIEQIPLGRVAERIERAADADRGMVLDPGEVGLIAGLPGASERMRQAAGAGRAVRATSEEVAALVSDEVREIAKLMRLEGQHRAAAGKAHADLLLETGGVSTLDVVQSLEGNTWKYAKTMPDIPHWYCMMDSWRGPLGYHVAMGVIRTRGVRKRWGPYYHPYLHANGWKYWVMSTSTVEEYPVPPEGGIINRARADDGETAFDILAGKLPELKEEHDAAAGLELRGTVLDIGVGEGWLTRRVPVHRYLGLEPSGRMLQSAAAQCPLHASRMLLCTLRNFHTALRFDTVAAVGTASYLQPDDWAKAWSLVAPGGALVAVWLRERLPSPAPLSEPHRAVAQMELCELPGGVVTGMARRGTTAHQDPRG